MNINTKPQTIILLVKNIRENICNYVLKKDFLDITQKQGAKQKNEH